MKHNEEVDVEIKRLLDALKQATPGTEAYDAIEKELDILYARRLQEESHNDNAEIEAMRVENEEKRIKSEERSRTKTMGLIALLTGGAYVLEAKGYLVPKDLLRWVDKIRFK